MARRPKQKSGAFGATNTAHLVLSTTDPHPPFVQEVPGEPGEVEKCVWDDTINGYRCSIIPADNA
jgi:hypothetical protein